MKRLLVVLSAGVLLSACSIWPERLTYRKANPDAERERAAHTAATFSKRADAPAAEVVPIYDANGAEVRRVPFTPGVSTVTVENLAKAQGCVGGTGAGLITPAGPVETYRLVCADGKVFTASCQSRQCALVR